MVNMEKLKSSIYKKVISLKPDYLVAKINFEGQTGFNQNIAPGRSIVYPTDLDIRYLDLSIPSEHTYTAKNTFFKLALEMGVKGLFITQSNTILPQNILNSLFNFELGYITCLNLPAEGKNIPSVLNNTNQRLQSISDFSTGPVFSNWFLPFESFYIPMGKLGKVTDTDVFKPLVEGGKFVCSPEIYFLSLMVKFGVKSCLDPNLKAIRVGKDGVLSIPQNTDLKKYRFA